MLRDVRGDRGEAGRLQEVLQHEDVLKVCFAQAVVNEHTLESRGFDYVPYSRVLVGYSRIRGWTRQPHIMLLFGDDRVRQMTEEINEEEFLRTMKMNRAEPSREDVARP